MKKSMVIALAAIVILAGLIFFGLKQQEQYLPQQTQLAFDNLSGVIERAQRIALTNNNQTIHLAEVDGKWVLEESGNYPIEIEELRNLVTKLSDSKKLEAKSDNPDNYPSYGLDKPSTFVAFNKDGEEITKLQLGQRMNQLDGWYALIDDDPRVWVISEELAIDTQPRDWLVKQVVSIPGADWQEIVTQDFTLRKEDGEMQMLLEEGEELDIGKVNQLINSLSGLNLLDASKDRSDFSSDTQASLITKGGLKLDVEVGKTTNGDFWAKFDASAKQDLIQLDNTADSADSLYAQAQEQARDIEQRLTDYWLRLPSSAGEALMFTRSDLLKK